MAKPKRGWHNPQKDVKGTTEGKCPYCHKKVKSLEKHIHDKHKGEKGSASKVKGLIFGRAMKKR
jgi:protein-disulfide isomerase